MADLTGDHDVKAICPRCKGNVVIVVEGKTIRLVPSVTIKCLSCYRPISVVSMSREALNQSGRKQGKQFDMI